MEADKLDQLLKEKEILRRVKVESYILPYLGLRPVSQITIPAEFPRGPDMGRKIDEGARHLLVKLQSIREPRGKAAAIQALKKFLENSFEETVEESENYKAHYRWADELKLRTNQFEVRPTVHEIYLFKDRSRGRELNLLMKERERLRRRVRRKPDPQMGEVRFAYPEEFDEKWILRMGELLGYPECCSKRYARDRVNGINVEVRAANQLLSSLKEDAPVDPHVYLLGYFFPCDPSCENALNLGKTWEDKLIELDPRVGSLYDEVLKENLKRVQEQPELIQRYMNQVKP